MPCKTLVEASFSGVASPQNTRATKRFIAKPLLGFHFIKQKIKPNLSLKKETNVELSKEIPRCTSELFLLHFRKTSRVRWANEVNEEGRLGISSACEGVLVSFTRSRITFKLTIISHVSSQFALAWQQKEGYSRAGNEVGSIVLQQHCVLTCFQTSSLLISTGQLNIIGHFPRVSRA